jgi:hypothetical protein
MRGFACVLAIASMLTLAAPSAEAQKGDKAKGAIWSDGLTSDPKHIGTLLAAVPITDRDMTYANLGERLKLLGIRVTRVDAGPVSPDDVKLDSSLRRGDVDYRLYTTEPTSMVNQLCPLMPAFNLVRRGQQWIARDRTSNFLMNGYAHCRAPA